MNETNKSSYETRLSPLDRYLRALVDQERRVVLYYLEEKEDANSEELARQIATRNSDEPPSTVLEEEWKPIQTKLHHQHLPQLRDYGVIDFDQRSKDVHLSRLPPLFMVLLRFCRLVESE